MRSVFGVAWLCLAFLGNIALAETRYAKPSPALAGLLEAKTTPALFVNPDRTLLLAAEEQALPGIAELAQPELRLAGLRINPRNFGPSRSRDYVALSLIAVDSGKSYPVIGFPAEAKLRDISFSPNGRYVATVVAGEAAQHLWLIDVASRSAKRLGKGSLSSVFGTSYRWLPNSSGLLVLFAAHAGKSAPAAPLAPTGPIVQETSKAKAPERTYQDLLQNPYDESLFAFYATTQLARLDLRGKQTLLGLPHMVTDIEISPNGSYALVTSLHQPFSYLSLYDRFPQLTEVLDLKTNTTRTLVDLPLVKSMSTDFDAVRPGPRNIAFRPDKPAEIYWTEALDGGDPAINTPFRDKLVSCAVPCKALPHTLAEVDLRLRGVTWSASGFALLSGSRWKDRKEKLWYLPATQPASLALVYERSSEDRYNDPGSPMTKANATGHHVLETDASSDGLYFVGDGASDEGDRPFLDYFSLSTRQTKRLFRSQTPFYERPALLLGASASSLLFRREGVDTQPNYFVRDLASSSERQLTAFPHPSPQLNGLHKEIVRYKRADGVALSATLYLPPGYDKSRDGALPFVLWAYPQEFKTAAAAGQISDSPYRFSRVSPHSPLLFLAAGYGVLDDPAMPIIGEGTIEPNDTYVDQLSSSAKAAVDFLVQSGYGKPGALAIGGHSYGAFMTANLLAHTDLFACGIARSGAYNRTLTPFGFQSEERHFWLAKETYMTMSPFANAEKINEPLLLIHGSADNNTGTFPMQSERLFSAIKGLGGTAKLVLLPHESHGYRARESLLHMAAEMEAWLKAHVKRQ